MFKGKAIYNPSGKAGEYSYWACNFYIGCSNGYTYCYLKKGRGAKVLGGAIPALKKCFIDESHAIKVFKRELKLNIKALKEHGLFFSFTTDPMLPETYDLTITAAISAIFRGVPVKILTKCTGWINPFIDELFTIDIPGLYKRKHLLAIGFTLTGHDKLEPGAATNYERISAMKNLSLEGFKTFASIEPVIDFPSSLGVILETKNFCDLYKIGLESGAKYKPKEIIKFMSDVNFILPLSSRNIVPKVYWKDSLLKQVGVERSELPENCVTRDYNMFDDK